MHNYLQKEFTSVSVEIICAFDLQECNLYLFISSDSLTVFTRTDDRRGHVRMVVGFITYSISAYNK